MNVKINNTSCVKDLLEKYGHTLIVVENILINRIENNNKEKNIIERLDVIVTATKKPPYNDLIKLVNENKLIKLVNEYNTFLVKTFDICNNNNSGNLLIEE